MKANVGDRLLVHGHVTGQSNREGEIIEVRSADGTPPYLVRFNDGHDALVCPGPDAVVKPALTQ